MRSFTLRLAVFGSLAALSAASGADTVSGRIVAAVRATPRIASRCAPHGSHTLLRTAVVRVFRTRRTRDPRVPFVHRDAVYACSLPQGKRTLLTRETDNADESISLGTIRTGPGSPSVIGYLVHVVPGVEGSFDHLYSLDAASGRRLLSNTADTTSLYKVYVQEFALTPRGSLAWIGEGSGCPGADPRSRQAGYGVLVISSDGTERALQCAPAGTGENGLSGLTYAAGEVAWTAPDGRHSMPFA